jgi:hypothetical protein
MEGKVCTEVQGGATRAHRCVLIIQSGRFHIFLILFVLQVQHSHVSRS